MQQKSGHVFVWNIFRMFWVVKRRIGWWETHQSIRNLKKVERRRRWWGKWWRNKSEKGRTWTNEQGIVQFWAFFQFTCGFSSTWWVSLVALSYGLPTHQKSFYRRFRLFRARAYCRHQFEPRNFFSLIFPVSNRPWFLVHTCGIQGNASHRNADVAAGASRTRSHDKGVRGVGFLWSHNVFIVVSICEWFMIVTFESQNVTNVQ